MAVINQSENWSVFFRNSGGLNTTSSEVNLREDEALEAIDVDLHVDGKVLKRKGAAKLNAVTVGAGRHGNGIVHFKPMLGTARYVAAFGDSLYEWSGTAWNLIYGPGLNPTAIVLFVPFRNLLYIQNGIDVPLVYAPHLAPPTVFRPGEPRPATAASFNANIAGAMTVGNIQVRVRFVSPISDIFVGEPDVDLGTTISVSLGGVRINIPVYAGAPAPDYRVAKRVIERTKVGGAVFYQDGFVNDNTTTTYDITQADSVLELNPIGPLPGYRVPMPILFPFTSYNNRIVGFDPGDLGMAFFSEIDEFGILPEAFAPLEFNFHRLKIDDEFDRPMAMSAVGDYINVFTGRSIHVLSIDPQGNTFSRRLSGYDVGVPNARSVLEIPDGNIVFTYKGPYVFTRNRFTHIGERIEETLRQMPRNKLDQVYMLHLYDRRQIKIVLPGATGSSAQNDCAFVYHYSRDSLRPEGFPTDHAWTIYRGFLAKSGMVTRDESTKQDVEFSLDYDGFAYREATGDTDAHRADGQINASFKTGWKDMDRPHAVKDFTELLVVTDIKSPGKLRVEWATDFGNGVMGNALLESGAESAPALWDSAIWDQAVFEGGETVVLHAHLSQDGVGAVGRYLSLRFYQDAADRMNPWSIIGYLVKWQEIQERSDAVG